MNFLKNFYLIILIFILVSVNNASDLELKGNFIQGGLIIGKTDKETKVFLDDTLVTKDSEGYFLFGFHRNHSKRAILKTIDKNKNHFFKELKVEQRKYIIQKINNLQKNKVTPPKAFYKRINAEIELIKKAKKVLVTKSYYKKGFIMPASGIITGVYGSQRVLNGKPRRPHYGLDIANKTGTDVIATSDGVIVLAEKDLYFSGGTIIMSHGYGLTSSYLHLSKILVRVGDKVYQGQKVAEIGSTGRATGPHLDWRMEIKGVRIDPNLLLNK